MKVDSNGICTAIKVEAGHPLIDKYVVEASKSITLTRAKKVCSAQNKMVKARDGVTDRFRVARKKNKYIVVRRLLIGDHEDFIEEWLEGEVNDKSM